MKHLSIIIILILAIGLASYPIQASWYEEELLVKNLDELKDWESLFELKVFLELHSDAPLVLASGESFTGQCENFAFQLRDRAEAWGRRLEVEILTPYEMYEYYHKREAGYHAINKAVIGNEWWYVDVSEAEYKLWHPLNLD